MQEMKNLPGAYVEMYSSVQDVRNIPKLGHAEARELATSELELMLAQLELLSADDWQLPTVCTLWNVTQMVAHIAGAAAGYAKWSEVKRQFIRNPYMSKGTAKVDALSQCQVEDRAGATPEALMAELRVVGPRAIRVRHRLPWILRAARVPLGPPLGFSPLGYLTDLIYTRDMWMHRLDICRAAGLEMSLSAAHDGRIIDLVMRDLGRKLRGRLGKRHIKVELTGPAGSVFDFGSGSAPSATIQVDALEFNWLAAGRTTPEDIMSEIAITGDADDAKWFFANIDVPY